MKFFTDHRNLLALFADEARPLSCSKSNRDKMTRWGLQLLEVYYTIHHIDGVYNYLADLGSRWGNQFAQRRLEDDLEKKGAAKKGLRRGPQPLLTYLVQDPPKFCPEVDSVPKRVLRMPRPMVSDKARGMDLDIKGPLLSPDEKNLVSRDALHESQQQYAKHRSTEVK